MRKNLLGMLSIALALGANHNPKDTTTPMRDLPTPEEQKRREEENLKKFYKANGLREFTIYGKTIYALNYKNALRKYNKSSNPK